MFDGNKNKYEKEMIFCCCKKMSSYAVNFHGKVVGI